MSILGRVLSDVLFAFWLLLLFRLVMEYVFLFARNYRPSGLMAGLLEVVYSITDPPLKLFRRFLPPLRIGRSGFALDLAFFVLFAVVVVLQQVVAGL
jgi:YggT family protein